MNKFEPQPELGAVRRDEALERRGEATKLSGSATVLRQVSNKEEDRFPKTHPTSFTKGLQHDDHGLAATEDYADFRDALVNAAPNMNCLDIAAGPDQRKWESPLAGHYFTLQGPDPDAVAMAPAPKLGLSELAAEMASVYAMALTRDLTFTELDDPAHVIPGLTMPDGATPVTVGDILADLKKLSWFDKSQSPKGYFGAALLPHEQRRRAAAWDDNGDLTMGTLFRGSTRGAKQGPYISQFMLLGTGNKAGTRAPEDGKIIYGVQSVAQQLEVAADGIDFMTNWSDWLHVQNGADTSKQERYPACRRVATPRDLATYVHFDALYQAYLNACLILLDAGVPTDGGNPIAQSREKNSEGFATWGAPHILSLVTEVATRGLRAVRRQKFQIHRRARPEVIAARLAQVANGHTGHMDPEAVQKIEAMLAELGHGQADPNRPLILDWIAQHNAAQTTSLGAPAVANPVDAGCNYLLPMAFSEGSPMHPAYGAGHATVAGACVTILKAFFESELSLASVPGAATLFEADRADALNPAARQADVTIGDELDKLAANISIGRNMAGVHFYSDYYDSLRLGERIAVGILEEQMLTYQEPVRLCLRSFDGEQITISTEGTGASGDVTTTVSGPLSRAAWWVKDIVDYGIAPSIG